MTIGKIAESQMQTLEVEKINYYLKAWEHNYPSLSQMVTACVFPDHLNCKNKDPLCEALPFIDDVQLFKHIVYIPYNPLGLNEEMILKPRKWGSHGLNFTLNTIKDHVNKMKKYPCTRQACEVQIGSDFSWNLYLRLFLHLYGDLHVPCHCCNGINKQFPFGDNMARDIFISHPLSDFKNMTDPIINSLHYYIDSIGNKFYQTLPYLSMKEVEDNSKNLMLKYPLSHYAKEMENLHHWDIDGITMESFDIQVKIYEMVNFMDYNPDDGLHLTNETEQKIKNILEERIPLAGYRLGRCMKEFASALPDLDANFYSILNKPSHTSESKRNEL